MMASATWPPNRRYRHDARRGIATRMFLRPNTAPGSDTLEAQGAAPPAAGRATSHSRWVLPLLAVVGYAAVVRHVCTPDPVPGPRRTGRRNVVAMILSLARIAVQLGVASDYVSVDLQHDTPRHCCATPGET